MNLCFFLFLLGMIFPFLNFFCGTRRDFLQEVVKIVKCIFCAVYDLGLLVSQVEELENPMGNDSSESDIIVFVPK